MLLDLCVLQKFSIMGARPMLVFLLILSVALLESDFVKMLCVTVIASVVYALMGAQSFGMELVLCVCIALSAYYLKKFPRHMKGVVRATVFGGVSAAIHSVLMHFYNFNQIGVTTIFRTVLPSLVYNAVLSAVVFWLLRISVYENEINKESVFGYAKR